MNELTEKAIFYSKFHSRVRVSDRRREAPNFTHWFLKRMGWGTSLGLHTDPAQSKVVLGPLLPPPPQLQFPACLRLIMSTRAGRACQLTMAAMTSGHAIANNREERTTRGERLGQCADCKSEEKSQILNIHPYPKQGENDLPKRAPSLYQDSE